MMMMMAAAAAALEHSVPEFSMLLVLGCMLYVIACVFPS
jgi:hypothetical protein